MSQYQAQAKAHQIVTCGKARFTVLTSRAIRCEWHEAGQFEDRATLSVVNRAMAKVGFTVEERGKGLILRTADLELCCTDCSKPFSKRSLSATFALGAKKQAWHFGQKDNANLGGTIRTLDEVDGEMKKTWFKNEAGTWTFEWKKVSLGQGLISRSGWSVHDDSDTIAVGPREGAYKDWAQERHPGRRQDCYLFAYGHDYCACLGDAARIFGRQPLPPRYALGYWYSKYWAYTDKEIEDLVDQHDRMGAPIDVMVIDMDWHELGWTGYTWSRDFFPDPVELLQELHRRGIRTTLNLHPADGVSRKEAAFEPMRKRLGIPKKAEKITFDICDPAYMQAYFEELHHPLEDEGVDFWWMDWQQGQGSKLPGLDPLPWLNQLHYDDQLERRPQRRALDFSRYGGLGSGRYPVGFSGDTYSTWKSLAFQPRLTAQSANVLYGMWSHDIGGHMPGRIEPELYLRWLQFGVFSPVLRTHTTKNPESERRIWQYPAPYDGLMIAELQRRYAMLPYIYSELRRVVDSGVSLLRPMYYHSPANEDAYAVPNQYWFGNERIVAPVVSPANSKTEEATVRFWLPKGSWIDCARGERLSGGWHEQGYRIDEIPVFVRPGAVLPAQLEARRCGEGYDHLLIEAWAGGDGSYTLYEDDGESTRYQQGESASILLGHTENGSARSLSLGAIKGSYRGLKAKRQLTFTVHCAAPADTVCLGKSALPFSYRGGPGTWRYDGDTCSLIIDCGTVDLRVAQRVSIKHAALPAKQLDGLPGLLRRLRRVMEFSSLASQSHFLQDDERLGVKVGQCGNRMSRQPEHIGEELAQLRKDLKLLPEVLGRYSRGLKKKNATGAQAYIDQARAIVKTLSL
jgi:alpha-glucosidase